MNVLEFAAQGVRGFSSAVRLPLKPGLNAVASPGEPEAPLGSVALALLYADGRGGESVFAVPGQTAKAALTFSAKNGSVFRLLRELGGVGALQRMAQGKPEKITQNPQEILNYLRSELGLPSRSEFESLCVLTRAQRPSRRPKSQAAPSRTVSGSHPAADALAPVTPAADVEAARQRVGELEQELALTKEIETLQFEQDGVAADIFKTERKLEPVSRLRDELATAQQSLAEAPDPVALGYPADMLALVERYPDATAKRDEALARVKQEKLEAHEEVPPEDEEHVPLVRDPRFWGAVAAGCVFLGCGFYFPGAAKYLALLDLPAFGFAAVLALRHVDTLQRRDQCDRKIERLTAREQKIQEDYTAETDLVRAGMERFGFTRSEQLGDLLRRRPFFEAQLRKLQADLRTLEAQPETVGALAELKALNERQESLNQQLLDKGGGYVRDAREVERELERLKESIELAMNSESQAAKVEAWDALMDPGPELLASAAELMRTDVASVAAQVRDRCLQYFAALTDRRYARIEIAETGALSAQAATGEQIPAERLPAADLDWLYLSLRLTIGERALGPSQLPLFIDDGLVGLEEPKLPLLGRMLKHLGTLVQVVVVSKHPGISGAADHQAAA